MVDTYRATRVWFPSNSRTDRAQNPGPDRRDLEGSDGPASEPRSVAAWFGGGQNEKLDAMKKWQGMGISCLKREAGWTLRQTSQTGEGRKTEQSDRRFSKHRGWTLSTCGYRSTRASTTGLTEVSLPKRQSSGETRRRVGRGRPNGATSLTILVDVVKCFESPRARASHADS